MIVYRGIQQKKPYPIRIGLYKKRRRHTLPQNAVPSAQAGLTSLFGMGRGEPRRNNHLKSFKAIAINHKALASCFVH